MTVPPTAPEGAAVCSRRMLNRADHRGNRNAWPVLAGQGVSLLGDYIAFLAVPLFVYDLTGTGTDLGMTMAFETLPTLLFGFAAGVALDRISIRGALVTADLVRAAAFGLLALSVVAGAPQVWIVFAVAFLVGSMGIVFEAGLQAWLPALFEDEELVLINSRLQVLRTVSWSVGPALAPFLIVTIGYGGTFLVDAATFIVSALFVLVLVERRPRPPVEHEPWWPAFTTGIRYLWNERVLRAATGAALVFNLTFIPLEALLVKFAAESLDIGGSGIGWFYAGHAILGAAGVVLAPRLIARFDLGRTFVFGLAGLGAGFFFLTMAAPGIAELDEVASVVVAILPAGIAVGGVSVANVAFFTLRQTVPPEELRGRIIAASRTLSWAGIPVGAAVGGVLGDVLGVRAVYLAASSILLLVSALVVLTPLWSYRSMPEVAPTNWLLPPDAD